MLETRHNDRHGRDRTAEALGRYLGTTLHTRITLRDYAGMKQVPSFLDQAYKIYESSIAARKCVFLITRNDTSTPSQIAKHLHQVQMCDDAIVIFVSSTMNPHKRNRLVAQGVPFVVPGNQLYIPQLAMDLRERFRTGTSSQGDGLSSAAPAVLFHHLLRRNVQTRTLSGFARELGYTKMSISRAFDALVAAGLAETGAHGRERHISFPQGRRQLFRNALPRLRSPVRARKFIRGDNLPDDFNAPLRLAGESALAKMTSLSAPDIETYAVSSRDWMTVSKNCAFQEVGQYEADLLIETWTYNPASLVDAGVVDPLSLYTQFHNHHDARVSKAAESLLENIKW